MTRAAAKNHAWVTIVTSPDQYEPLLDELRANGGEVTDATRARVRARRRSRARPPTTPRSSSGCRTASSSRVTWCSRSIAPTKCSATARTRTSPRRGTAATARRAGGTPCSSTAVSRSRTSTTTTPTPRGTSCTTSATVRPARSSSTPTRAAYAVGDDLATVYQRALECDERSAFGGIVALNRPIDAATVERMVAGPQADLVIAPGYEAGAIDALRQRRKNTRILEAPAPGREIDRRAPDLGWLPAAGAASFRVDAQRLAGRHEGRSHSGAVARHRARVADLRPREVERDRAREGRVRRSGSAPVSRTVSSRARSRRRRPRGVPSAARARATRSTRSRTGSRRRPRPASPP